MSNAPTDDEQTPPIEPTAALDSPEAEVEELDLVESSAPAIDLLHTYVRQIGDGALLTHEEEAERADAEAQRADAAVQRADAEAQRRMDAERRLAELTAELERLRHGNSSG